MGKDSGVTLMELLTVIGIIGIVSAFAFPNIISWLPSYRLGSAARQILSTVEYARLAAIKENISIGIGFSIPNDYNLWRDDGGTGGVADDGVQQAGEPDFRTGKMPAGVVITAADFGGEKWFRFNRAGFSIRENGSPGGGTVSLANSQGDTSSITITTGGNAKIVQ